MGTTNAQNRATLHGVRGAYRRRRVFGVLPPRPEPVCVRRGTVRGRFYLDGAEKETSQGDNGALALPFAVTKTAYRRKNL